MIENTCCFFGHRRITETAELRARLTDSIEKLITREGVDTFLFGSKSRFDELCLESVTELKAKYPHVKRIYVRAEYPFVTDEYNEYLQELYEETIYPERITRAGRAAYVERNREMIDKSKYCVVYYDETYQPKNRKSGTRIALVCAVKRGKTIINVFSVT